MPKSPTKTRVSWWQNFMRGAGSVIDLQPNTRQNRSPEKLKFTRTVFINGRKHQLDAKRDPFKATVEAFTADWGKIAGDVERATMRLPAAVRANATRRLTTR